MNASKFSLDVLARVQHAWGGYDDWQGEHPRRDSLHRGEFRIFCGEGRFDPVRKNAVVHKRSGVALNFQIALAADKVESFEFSLTWLDLDWTLMFHLDPRQANWPAHPLHHIQFQAPKVCTGTPPFSGWRIPFGETEPDRILMYVVHCLENEP